MDGSVFLRVVSNDLTWQPSLFDGVEASFDGEFRGLHRIHLDHRAWVDYQPGWVRGADALFATVAEGRDWGQRSRHMYTGRVLEPRLTAPWHLASGSPLEPAVLEEMRQALGTRYEVVFDSVGFNLYRDGRDSVAWHGDRISKEIEEPIVVLVSLGHPRRLMFRPKGGGTSQAFTLGPGDLLVTGGTTQRTWEHSVPKVRDAGPRISLAFRHAMDPNAYQAERVEPVTRR